MDHYSLYMPVIQKDRALGTLYLKADYRQMYHRLTMYGAASLIVLVGCTILAFLLSNGLERWISRPLLDLAKVAQIVSKKKDYSVRATTVSQDELGTLTDAFNSMLTQIQANHAAIRDSEQRFRMIADHIPVLAWTANERGEATWYNQRWHEYTGMSRIDPAPRDWEPWCHPLHLERVKESFRQAIQNQTSWTDTFPLRGQDEIYRWFLSSAMPIFDEEGRITRWFGTNVDVTQLREAEESCSHLAIIVNASQDAIISKGLDGMIRTWNPGAERMFGYTDREAIGRSIMILVPPELLQEEESILERQKKGEAIEHYETVRIRKDGTRVDVSLSVSPLHDSSGAVIGASTIARDITEKKRAEREMERARNAAEAANRAKDDFLAALSHELRTPLMPVLFTISTLQQERSLPEHLRENLAMIRRNIEIQARMVNDLLDLSRIRINRLELATDPVNLHESVERALEVCRSHKKAAKLKLTVKLNATNHYVRGDADRLQQVFWNLIQNAIKFTPEDGRINVESSNLNGIVRITVTDTGCGIEPELLSKIFEPFEQAGRRGKESLQGLGLGLAIAQRIVAAHGGTLTAASEGLGRGAVFATELQTISPPAGAAPVLHQPELVQSHL